MLGVVYGLTNPINNNKVFYVGQTIKNVNYRLNEHIREISWNNRKGVNVNKNNEILDIISKCKTPKIIVLEYVYDTQDNLDAREIYWISYYRQINNKLTNIANGGLNTTRKSNINLVRGIKRLKRFNYPLNQIAKIYHMSENEVLKIFAL